MQKPVLSVQTVYFDDTDRDAARRLGEDLYHHLTRPADDSLEYGANIPVLVGVRHDLVDLEVADTVVLIPVLGKTTFNMMVEQTVGAIRDWHQRLGEGHVLPVPTSSNWRNVDEQLPGTPLLTELYAKEDPRRKTLDEIVIGIGRLLDSDPSNMKLFVSHAKLDLSPTDAAAKKIHDYAVTDTTASSFFDATDLRPGESLNEQLYEAVTRGVLISVRGDSYSSRVWCQRELLQAKQYGLPTLVVEVLKRGEKRSSPYIGNSPCIVWDRNPATIVSIAMVEWLRAVYFKHDAPRIIQAAELPTDVKVVSRAPELLDFAQGPLRNDHPKLVLHPDPELSVVERHVLNAAKPRLQLVTPTTAFRGVLNRSDRDAQVTSPLEGFQIALSLSDSPEADGPEGFTAAHVKDATVYVARTLVSAGAAIGYGGDYRPGGFTELLARLIQSYNQTATRNVELLNNYIAAVIRPGDSPEGLLLSIHHMVQSTEMAKHTVMPAPAANDSHPDALYHSDMRRVMPKFTCARVILGGQATPRTVAGGPGYGGRYPGIVEEAWRTLEAGQPLYVLGGFGGAAALVADLLEGKKTPSRLQDETWMSHEFFRKNADAIDNDPYREKLGLPTRMEDLADEIRSVSNQFMKDDQSIQDWNGLTLDENLQLFRSRDPVTLASLVSKGLRRVVREKTASQRQIELVNGSVTSANQLDAIAIATIDDVPLGGAGAALDHSINGLATLNRAQGRSFVSLTDASIDADWLLMVSLGKLAGETPWDRRITDAARQASEMVRQHGFDRLGIVTFGGSLLSDVDVVAHAMLEGFKELPQRVVLVWFETDDSRFNSLHKLLREVESIHLTTRRAVTTIAAPQVNPEMLRLDVRLQDSELVCTTLLPTGGSVASMQRTTITDKQLIELTQGSGPYGRGTPDLVTLRQRGEQLANILFGDQAAEILSRCRESKVVVLHDVAAAKIPFEMLGTNDPDIRPAVESGLTRRLAIADVSARSQFERPPRKGKLRVLLIVNPTGDLPGTEHEANKVREIFAQQGDHLDLVHDMPGKEATKSAVIEALQDVDVMHYCGHGFFDGPNPGESGLVLSGHEQLTAMDLRQLQQVPRFIFANACEAGRLRGKTKEIPPNVFAEIFLRGGVESYLGTYWEVQDIAAATFATTVYTQLALGTTLETAVRHAREQLFQANQPDWANYILYGTGNFRLITNRTI